MLSSARFKGTASIPARGELLTTSRVLVKDGEGSQYLTVASHSFALREETVYHPNPNGVAIADVERRLSYTDIALTQLKSSITYQNETFENSTTTGLVLFFRFLISNGPESGLAIGLAALEL